jgi:CHAD domain-containing protein
VADGKWITDLEATTPLTDAARRVLTVRLQVVHERLPLAMRQADEDPEHVHQLRVATRRAGAALDIFALCLPEKPYRQARKALRRIRRAAGAARDWDVFLLGLPPAEDQREGQRPAYDLLTGYAVGQRRLAQADLEDACPDYPFSFERLMAETVAAVRKPAADPELRTLHDLAQPMLSQQLQELDQAVARDLNDYDHLHQVRIIGKRLRYAMELFVDCFGPEFRNQLYPAVEEMHEILGEANDSHVAYQRLSDLRQGLKTLRPKHWRRFQTGLDALRRHHDKRTAERQRAFIAWWGDWQETGGETAFKALLKTETPPFEEPRSHAS